MYCKDFYCVVFVRNLLLLVVMMLSDSILVAMDSCSTVNTSPTVNIKYITYSLTGQQL